MLPFELGPQKGRGRVFNQRILLEEVMGQPVNVLTPKLHTPQLHESVLRR